MLTCNCVRLWLLIFTTGIRGSFEHAMQSVVCGRDSGTQIYAEVFSFVLSGVLILEVTCAPERKCFGMEIS